MGLQLRDTLPALCADQRRRLAMSTLIDLLSLQKIDTGISQANHRLTHLSEIALHKQGSAGLESVRSQLQLAVKRSAQVESDIAKCDGESRQVDVKAERLRKQLRTVIAPREAEALQHEIAQCELDRGVLDDKELELMGLVEDLTAQIAQLARAEGELVAAVAAALTNLRAAQTSVKTEIAELADRRSAICLMIPAQYMTQYEHKRKHISGGAVAELHGRTCQSCHLDISRGELAALKDLPPGEFAECPNCDCYLVI